MQTTECMPLVYQLFKDEKCMFYTRPKYVPRSKHYSSRLRKTKLLMLYKAKLPVCCGISTEFVNVKPGVK